MITGVKARVIFMHLIWLLRMEEHFIIILLILSLLINAFTRNLEKQ